MDAHGPTEDPLDRAHDAVPSDEDRSVGDIVGGEHRHVVGEELAQI